MKNNGDDVVPVKSERPLTIDGKFIGREVNIIQPLNSFSVFVVKTDIGEQQHVDYV